jgi:hypothetical protein
MTQTLHPQVETLVRRFSRDLAQISPSDSLDARIGELVAGKKPVRQIHAARHPQRLPRWAAAAGVAALAIVTGVFIGMNLERRAQRQTIAADSREPAWPPADFSMWPADSVALQIPAEYSATGTLVAVDPKARTTGKRYWIDVVVSNDGTLRIEKVVPAEPAKNHNHGNRDGITLQTQ